ncbi:MAG: terminase family protein [Nitrososphaerales archaeon]
MAVDPELLEPLTDPVIFSEALLNFKPFNYQEKLLRDESRRICACMGRQTGKSSTISAKAIHFAVTNARTTTLIVSATLRQSMLMFDKILAFIETSPIIASYIAYRSRTRVRFKNHSWIIALPCGRSGATLRGHTSHLVILDEAAFIPEEVISNVVLPMLSTTDGSCWMLSTPYDREHIFYKAFNDPTWSVYHLPSSVNPLVSKKFLEEQRHLVGEINYKQEYEAQFVDDVNTYFPMMLIRPCIDPELSEVYELKEYEEATYAGYDPGGKQDPAALVVVTKNKDGYAVRFVKTWLGQDYTTTDFAVVDICKSMNVEKLAVDQTGLGSPITEHFNEIYQKERVEGIFLTHKRKEELLLSLKLLFEQRLVRIPNDRDLLANLNCITYERSHSGNYYYKHAHGTHDDLAYALALAVWAAKSNEEGVVIKV